MSLSLTLTYSGDFGFLFNITEVETLDKTFLLSPADIKEFGGAFDVVWDKADRELCIVPSRLLHCRYNTRDVVWTVRKESETRVTIVNKKTEEKQLLSLGEAGSFLEMAPPESNPVFLILGVRFFQKDD